MVVFDSFMPSCQNLTMVKKQAVVNIALNADN